MRKLRKIVANALESVVAKGTGRACYIDGYRIGGKTGTAQIAENGHYLSNKFILSFLAIAPMDNPKICVYLAIQNPHNAIQYGGTTVGPLVKEIMSESLSFLNVKKNYEGISYQPRLWVDKPLYKIPEYIGMNKKMLNITHIIILLLKELVILLLDKCRKLVNQ